ncbi:hypothetical protein [Gymnodinialimonas ulvae]|uniref:hypothetical protein n=1 Tax=Gymnodinialimonas ulvae TaxID=3126504 RepID=UPI00309D3B48
MRKLTYRLAKITLQFLSLCSLLVALTPLDISAAEIELHSSGPCNFSMTGPISQGDYAQLVEMRDEVIIRNQMGWTEGTRVCLDSEGGSVYEGVRIARFFYEEGVSTYVASGEICLSICGVMFMMGTIRGDEIARPERTLHVGGLLGFHRLYSTMDDAELFTSGEMNEMFNFGVESVFEILELANLRSPSGPGRMLHPDLLQLMLETPPNDMEFIDTVEEVVSFNIRLEGVTPVRTPDAFNYNAACENAIGALTIRPSMYYSGGVMSEEIFSLAPLPQYSVSTTLESETDVINGEPAYRVRTQRSGYYGSGCAVRSTVNVYEDHRSVSLCGYDERSYTQIGDCEGALRAWPEIIFHHPATDIALLAYDSGRSFDAARRTTCILQDAPEDCIQLAAIRIDRETHLLEHTFLTESGASVIVSVWADRHDGSLGNVLLNGEPAETLISSAMGISCVQPLNGETSFCINQ